MILAGDCVEVMAGMEPDSIDAIVTDPPYGLEFMGKEWDRLGPNVSRWEGRRTLTDGVAPTRKPDTPGGRHAAKVAAPSPNLRCATCRHYRFSGTPCKCESPVWEARPNEQAWRMQEWHTRWATEALRVAKPGAYLLAFGGTRTVHRLTVALEDAGWIIRDVLCWVYASGFPKSKSSLKPAWEPIVLARKPGPLRELAIDACRIGTDGGTTKGAKPEGTSLGIYGEGINGTVPIVDIGAGRWPANVILTDPAFDGGWDGVVGGGEASGSKPLDWTKAARRASFPVGRSESVFYDDTGTYSRFFMLPDDGRSGMLSVCHICGARVAESPSIARTQDGPTVPQSAAMPPLASHAQPASDAVSQSGSYATATAPSRAPTPLDGTVASTESEDVRTTPPAISGTATGSSPAPRPGTTSLSGTDARRAEPPATFIDTTTTTPDPVTCEHCAADATWHSTPRPEMQSGREPLPVEREGYTRFLIIPKASRRDREPDVPGELEATSEQDGTTVRNARCVKCKRVKFAADSTRCHCSEPTWEPSSTRRNTHPTVKPTALMRHLIRLVTPQGGTVLDPFLGSGSTAKAAVLEGFDWVGIEREPDYIRIAEQRLVGLKPAPEQLEMSA